ncbi:MAG: GNAT family N-acetyltransferase [Planctomycetes bacterium]|nr:GNAT family N-acetyltransferase [Planctomycetota bacterium]
MFVRPLEFDDLRRYIAHFAECNAESGADGAPHFHVYGRSEPYDQRAALLRERGRWSTPLDAAGWRRAWGLLLDEDRLIGHLYLEGGTLPAEMHRARLGMGVRREHYGRGGGRLLLAAALAWARAEPLLEWIDLGVFEENATARALYAAIGFTECGRTPDRYRVDGHRIDEIEMTLPVGGP